MTTDLRKKLLDLRRQFPQASFAWIWNRISQTNPELIRGDATHSEQARQSSPPQSRTNSKQYPVQPNTQIGKPIPIRLNSEMKARLQAAIEAEPEISIVQGGFATNLQM